MTIYERLRAIVLKENLEWIEGTWTGSGVPGVGGRGGWKWQWIRFVKHNTGSPFSEEKKPYFWCDAFERGNDGTEIVVRETRFSFAVSEPPLKDIGMLDCYPDAGMGTSLMSSRGVHDDGLVLTDEWLLKSWRFVSGVDPIWVEPSQEKGEPR